MSQADGLKRLDLIIIASLYAASTVLYAWLGVRWDASGLPAGMHFIDPGLLADRMIESLWYYHATPPMLNFLVGIGIKLFGDNTRVFCDVVFHALGLLVAFSIYVLTWRLSASRVAAAITTALLVFSPAFVLYENLLFYSFPAMALLIFATAALFQYQRTGSTAWCAGFFAILAALLLTRSLFHLAWMLAVTAGLVAVNWAKRKQILLAAAVPLLVVTGWCTKNYYYFGVFGTSSWMGLGLYNISTNLVPHQSLVPLVENGTLSHWALVSRYSSRGLMFLGQLRPPTGIPVLDTLNKPSGVNCNYRDIPAVSALYASDAFKVMRHFPATYVYGVVAANRMYFTPTSVHQFFTPENRAAVRPMEVLLTPVLSGVPLRPGIMLLSPAIFPDPLPVNTSVVLIVVWFGLMFYAYAYARRAVLDPARRTEPQAVVLGFIAVTAAYLYVVSTFLELGENNRYRFVIEPLFFVMAATAITSFIRARRSRRAIAATMAAS